MKITKVEIFPLEKISKARHIPQHGLVRIHTDEGICGWGSCYMPANFVGASLDYLSGRILGEDPREVERITEQLHQATYWFGRGGVLTTFISGVNIALWDIFGKAMGQSVSRLLGGRYREKIKPYASHLFRGSSDQMVERMLATKETGFRAFKLGWAPFGRIDTRTDEALVKALIGTTGVN